MIITGSLTKPRNPDGYLDLSTMNREPWDPDAVAPFDVWSGSGGDNAHTRRFRQAVRREFLEAYNGAMVDLSRYRDMVPRKYFVSNDTTLQEETP